MKTKNKLLHYGLSLLTAGAALFGALAPAYKKMDFTTYVFNLDQDKPTWVFAVGVSF